MSNGLSNDEFLAKWLNFDPEASKDLPESGELKELVDIAEKVAMMDVPARRSKAEALAMLQEKIAREQQIQEEPSRVVSLWTTYGKWAGAIAATLALVMGVYFFTGSDIKSFETEKGETLTVLLPDGSSVQMNENSQLAFNESKWEKTREIELEGEAFFDVEKGVPFTVHTNRLDVSVLGTSFSVKDDKKNAQVVCFSGKVKVNAKDQDFESVLLPSGFMSYKDSLWTDGEKISALFEDVPLWISGKVNFDAQPISVVLEALEDMYGVSVSYEGDEKKTFTGVILAGNLEKAVKGICEPMGLSFIFEGEEAVRIYEQ